MLVVKSESPGHAHTRVSPGGGEPLAVIGLACRLPGAHGPDAYWRLLKGGVDAIREVPPERWDVNLYHSEDPAAEGKMVTRFGGFLDGLDLFDNGFFGISAKEAARLDPQQRLMLEVAWEAFEDAGLAPERLAGTKTGVFVGSIGSEYDWPQARDVRLVNAYSPTGSALSILANRLSYFFDLGGPSISLDTACSSSLVAVSMACRSIWAGEAEMALAGGVSVILSPGPTIGMSKLSALAPDGRCKTFDSRANGYVRSEGAGAVVLKPLSRALADGDAVYAVIRGFAINNDGKTNGLTAPNRLAQVGLLKDAYACAGIEPSSVQYVEAHGTGTLLGDPIEATALGTVVGAGRETPCFVGSVKTNIGHLEGAAGVAALIKVCLMLKHREIPRSLHFEKPNPYIPFDTLGLRVVTEHQLWPEARPARAGVSAFGFGGTNCHVVLEEAPAEARESSAHPPREARSELLVFSAKSEEALLAQARAYREFLGASELPPLPAICRTAALRRAHHEHRAFVVGASEAELRERLEQLLSGQVTQQVGRARKSRAARPKVAFIYPGLGPQWHGMAQRLLREEPVFRETLLRVDALVQRHADWSVLEELEGEGAGEGLRTAHIEKIQTTLFAVQVALEALWRAWGLVPDAVIGHSMGEVAGAVAASVLTLEDAVRVMLERSRLLHASSGRGAMAAVELGLDEALALVRGREREVSIAASNSPETTVLSGDQGALEDILRGLEARGLSFRMVRTTGVAGHGPQLEEARHVLATALAGLTPRDGKLPFYSTKTGEREGGSRLDARYWGDQLREPVLFSRALERMRADGFAHFLELSPHPVLAEDVRRCFAAQGAEAVVLPSLRRNEDERGVMLGSLGRLHALGRPVKLAALFPESLPPVRLPPYAWQRSRFWLEADGVEGELDVVAPAGWVRDEAVLQRIQEDRWLYSVAWRSVPREARPARGGESGLWLVLCDGTGVGNRLAARLEQEGRPCVRVFAAERFSQVEPRAFTLPFESEGALEQLLDELGRGGPARIRGVVHLAGLEAEGGGAGDVLALGHTRTWRSLLALAKVLARRGASETPRVWVVTRGAQGVEGDAAVPNPLQGLLWGLGRTLANEMPSAWGGLVDLDAAASLEDAAAVLVDELLGGGDEDQVVLRGARRYCARLARTSLPAGGRRARHLRKDAAYLVTGGLGGLGLLVARHLAERGARRLILLGRTPLPSRERWSEVREGDAHFETIQGVLGLERLGTHVHVEALDVADAVRLDAFLARYRREGHPPIAGLVHSAGIVKDQLLVNLDTERFFEVLRPKVLGAWNLHQALRDTPLDFFVLFSSTAGLMGSPGQANYAAANAYLDGLAHARRAAGLPGLSIAWGPWAEVGLAHSPERGGRLALRGMGSLSPEAGIAVLGRLLERASPPHVAVLDASWPELFTAYDDLSGRPLYAELRAQASNGAPRAPASIDVAALGAMGPTARQEALSAYLRSLLGRVVGSAPEAIDEHRPLNQLGLDSLMVMELSNRLKGALGVKPGLELFARDTSTHELAAYLLERLGLGGVSTVGGEPARASSAPVRGDWLHRPVARPEARARAFCFAYAGAGPWVFHGLARALPESIELCMVQLPGRGTRAGEPLASALAGLEGPLSEALKPWLDKPFVLFGYSVGGLVAFETARALRRRGGRAPEALLIAASRAPHLPDPSPEIRDLDDGLFARELRRFGGTPEEVLRDPELMAEVLPLLRADFGLIKSYTFQEEPPLDLEIRAFGGTRDEVVRPDELRGWERHARRFELHLFDEAHFFLKPREVELARAISQVLTQK
jgi:acyl transferase domain-containing protein/surfactin synthase thioesterase subunit/aryl carrier-like protein